MAEIVFHITGYNFASGLCAANGGIGHFIAVFSAGKASGGVCSARCSCGAFGDVAAHDGGWFYRSVQRRCAAGADGCGFAGYVSAGAEMMAKSKPVKGSSGNTILIFSMAERCIFIAHSWHVESVCQLLNPQREKE